MLFAYIASSPFIVQEHYGFSAFGFSICFAANAVAIGLAAGLSVRFRQPENSTLASSIGMLALSIIVCIAMILNCNFWIYEGLLITLLFMMGFSFTSTIALAMECEREHAGAASALLGAVGFGFGGLVSPLVGLGDTMVTTGIVFMACELALWVAYFGQGRSTRYGKYLPSCGKGQHPHRHKTEIGKYLKTQKIYTQCVNLLCGPTWA